MDEDQVLGLVRSGDLPPWHAYTEELPGWASRNLSLFDAPTATFAAQVDSDSLGVAGVPFASTVSSRVGAHLGPRSIRIATLPYGLDAQHRAERALLDMRTGRKVKESPPKMYDYGDLHTFPSNAPKQILATASEAAEVARRHQQCLFLGGDHSLTYSFYCGVANAMKESGPKTLGYVHIDNHFDLGLQSQIHGLFYHGSNSRRILEQPDLDMRAVAFIGQGDITSVSQYNELVANGTIVCPISEIRDCGIKPALARAMDQVLTHCDALYVSIDIDVCDVSIAPGTGSVTLGGLGSNDFLDLADELKKYPVRALDIMEVSPELEAGGGTPFLAARFLYQHFWLT